MTRLDAYLVEQGLVRSRERAKEALEAGLVRVNGGPVRKGAKRIGPADRVTCEGETHPWVSRGALKLIAGLDAFGISPEGRTCLDLGASTGGFTEVLLSRGAATVYAVDVGHDQLVPALAADPRVVNLEGVHARDLGPALIPAPVSLLVCDVSFISLSKALPSALACCEPGAQAVVLIKPQFELGPAALGKKGIVRLSDEALRAWLADEMVPALEGLGWRVTGLADSPVKGGDGNTEFLARLDHD